jgi:hypothetical protein
MIYYKNYIKFVPSENGPYYEVIRTHSDGKVTKFRCSPRELNGKKPEDYLDRLLSQHLSGTGLKREKVSSLDDKK